MPSPFEGRVAVVTGSGGVLGQAVARHFLNLGALVVGIVRPGGTCPTLSDLEVRPCDLAREDAVRECIGELLDSHGRIDVLANIAGGFAMGAQVEDTTSDDWLDMLRINAATAWLACKYALPAMRKEDFGRIITIGARAVERPAARMAPYCVSKAAVVTLTQVLAKECSGTGITCNCILPGTIDTPRNQADMPKADHSRWVPPEDLARVVTQLADPENRSLNGAVIPVYGNS